MGDANNPEPQDAAATESCRTGGSVVVPIAAPLDLVYARSGPRVVGLLTILAIVPFPPYLIWLLASLYIFGIFYNKEY